MSADSRRRMKVHLLLNHVATTAMLLRIHSFGTAQTTAHDSAYDQENEIAGRFSVKN